MITRRLVSRAWFATTVLVLIAAGVCVRLGIWQLDRLEQRRSFNREYIVARQMQALDLNEPSEFGAGAVDWREARASGTYDFASQVAIRNQYWEGQYGYHLLTPLVLSPERVVLVDRGWIPAAGNEASADWGKYDERGQQVIHGQLRRGVAKPTVGGIPDRPASPGAPRSEFWNNLDIDQIAAQLPYPILPFFLQPATSDGDVDPPIPSQPDVELTEGPHLGYAFQWFTFAAMLLIGYPVYLSRQTERAAS